VLYGVLNEEPIGRSSIGSTDNFKATIFVHLNKISKSPKILAEKLSNERAVSCSNEKIYAVAGMISDPLAGILGALCLMPSPLNDSDKNLLELNKEQRGLELET